MLLSKNNTKVLILTHYSIKSKDGGDTGQRLRDYFAKRVKKVVHISHPLHDFPRGKGSILVIYKDAKKIKEINLSISKGPFFIKYILDTIVIYYFLIKASFEYNICIAMESVSFISMLPFRKLGKIKKLVYYSVDLVPERFQNTSVNKLYHYMDKIACTQADRLWVMVKEQINGRRKYGINSKNRSPHSIVPIGYETNKIKLKQVGKINYHNIVYMGGLRNIYGVELAVKAMPRLVNKLPNIFLTIIGKGKLENHLKNLTKKLKMERHIKFTDYVESFWDLTDILSSCSIGLAPYKPFPKSYSYYSDPSKIKLYMACGLPVITTDVVTMTDLIKQTKSGKIIKYTEQSLANAVYSMLNNKKKYEAYKNAASKLRTQFDINYILDNAVKEL